MRNSSENSSKRGLPDHALNIPKTLVLGYGNPDREDDGVAWHILKGLAVQFGLNFPSSYQDEIIQSNENLHLIFDLQLMPEIADELANYSRICFVDAHTGALQEDLNFQKLESKFQNSPLTHHMTPQTLLAILDSAYNHNPEAILVSVRGYQFGFEHNLSPLTRNLAILAIERISRWIVG